MNTPRTFQLYPEEQHWWSFNDYGAVLDVMERLRPKKMLEFGPGSSTLALIEGGAEHIDTCEDDPHWAQVYEERLVPRFPGIVSLHRYTWSDPLKIAAIARRRYDLALIDGPRDTTKRMPVIGYALMRCARVLVPTESATGGGNVLVPLTGFEDEYQVEWMETGPLAGGFALVTHR